MTPTAERCPVARDQTRLARVAGGVLLADGLRRIAGRTLAGRPTGRTKRRAGISDQLVPGAEALLGLTLLVRVPIQPESLYRAVAPVYDLLSPIWRLWLYRDPLRAFEGEFAAALPPGGDVLDLGCGTAAVLERLLALDVSFGTYTGVDLSPAMLARARTKFDQLPGVTFEQLDLRADPLPEGPFDLVVSAWALEHLPEPVGVVEAAMARVRPGGRLVLFFELDGRGPRAWTLRRLWRFFGVRLATEVEARIWPGLVSLRRFGGLGPDVALAVLAPEPTTTAS